MKLLIPIDASSYTQDAVAYLKRLRPSLAGTPHVVCLHVTYEAPPDADKSLAERARKILRDDDMAFGPERIVAELAGAGYEASLQLAQGDVATEILRLAGDVDLIVMGTHGRGTFTQAVMGSVATRVVSEGKAPVLLVK